MDNKPKLSLDDQINHMKTKGITFQIEDEHSALEYLESNNNYFKLRSYRKNYEQKKDGTYVNLEFAYLKDLAIIDMRMRYCLLEMCLDIEHHVRVKLVKSIENAQNEDGYSVVSDFRNMDAKSFDQHIDKAQNSPYCRDLVQSYSKDNMPIWVFVEIAQLGQLINFYRFVGDRLNDKEMQNDFYHLQDIRQLRNACAHSNCLINDLRGSGAQARRTDSAIVNAITACGISPTSRKKKMANERIRQIVTMLYFYNVFVRSTGLKKHRAKRLEADVKQRTQENRGFYSSNQLIQSTFDFLNILVDKWFIEAYNTPIVQKP